MRVRSCIKFKFVFTCMVYRSDLFRFLNSDRIFFAIRYIPNKNIFLKMSYKSSIMYCYNYIYISFCIFCTNLLIHIAFLADKVVPEPPNVTEKSLNADRLRFVFSKSQPLNHRSQWSLRRTPVSVFSARRAQDIIYINKIYHVVQAYSANTRFILIIA